jgi:hypothetical protein
MTADMSCGSETLAHRRLVRPWCPARRSCRRPLDTWSLPLDASAFAAAPRPVGDELEKANVQGRLIAHLTRPIPRRPAD